MSQSNFRSSNKLYEPIRRYLAETKSNVALTLTFNNGGLSRRYVDSKVVHFVKITNRWLFDGDYSKKRDQQLQGIFVIEKLDLNAHVHGICYIDPKFISNPNKRLFLNERLDRLWAETEGSIGTVDLRTPHCAPKPFEAKGWAKYITKEYKANRYKNSDDLIFAGGHFAPKVKK